MCPTYVLKLVSHRRSNIEGWRRLIDTSQPCAGWRVAMLIEGLDIQVVGLDGSPLRRLILDPTKGLPADALTGMSWPSMPRHTGLRCTRHHLSQNVVPETGLRPLGGGSGIRTHGALRHNGFRDRPIRPLSHPSVREASRDVDPRRKCVRSATTTGSTTSTTSSTRRSGFSTPQLLLKGASDGRLNRMSDAPPDRTSQDVT